MAVVAVAVLAACGSPDVTAERGAPARPDRPRELRVDGVDPCQLLSGTQRATLGLDGDPVPDASTLQTYPGRVSRCAISVVQPKAIVAIQSTVSTAGIDVWLTGEPIADIVPTAAGGFPAIVARPLNDVRATRCTVVVDVAAGQAFEVLVADGGKTPPVPQDELCQTAQLVADAAIATMLTKG